MIKVNWAAVNEFGKLAVLLATLFVMVLWLASIMQYRNSMVRAERIGDVMEIGDRY